LEPKGSVTRVYFREIKFMVPSGDGFAELAATMGVVPPEGREVHLIDPVRGTGQWYRVEKVRETYGGSDDHISIEQHFLQGGPFRVLPELCEVFLEPLSAAT
jgi:hypothetical protein